MPVLKRTTPCPHCPWLRSSLPGYLGADEPVHFYRQSVRWENDMPCHMTIDYDGDPDWQRTQLPGASLCAGQLAHLANRCQSPRDPKMAEAVRAVGPLRTVFATAIEFMRHHMRKASDEEVKAAVEEAARIGLNERELKALS